MPAMTVLNQEMINTVIAALDAFTFTVADLVRAAQEGHLQGRS